MSKIPFLLVGDGPADPTGLGRIARDLAALITTSDLPVDLVHVGGSAIPVWQGGWRHVPLDPTNQDWGAGQVQAIYQSLWGEQPGILMTIWDAGRLLPYAQMALPVQKWAYVAVDAENSQGRLGGPAAAALAGFDRVLGYGSWGARVLKRTLGRDLPYLPHGITPEVYDAPPTEEEALWAKAQIGAYRNRKDRLLGCVMTNQFRKDHGILMQLLSLLQEPDGEGRKWYGWLHTDQAVKAWAIGELVESLGLHKRVTVSFPEQGYSDRMLALLYQACDVTVLPSLGEGFGYPIVESLAAGTPCVHSDCAGGAELLPKTEWRVPVRAERLEGIYALRRPVMHAQDWVNAVRRAATWRDRVGESVTQAYCRGSVAHLDWTALWGRWQAWIRQGLDG